MNVFIGRSRSHRPADAAVARLCFAKRVGRVIDKPDLPKRKLGRTGLNVTALGFGALELRGMVAGVGRPLRPGQPESILNAVLDAGINYIDVAVDYGEAEDHIGRCISGRRQEFCWPPSAGARQMCPDSRRASARDSASHCPGCTTTAERTS